MSKELRFGFGKNWSRFLNLLNENRIESAEKSLLKYLGIDSLKGMSFLDIGSGSGLFSLAAHRLGALVTSFDYDVDSVECTKILREKYKDLNEWQVMQGSALDKEFLNTLGKFDIVYSWGVLHHTGSMYEAFENVAPLVKEKGYLFISIYNDQGAASRRWKWIKEKYNKSNNFMKFLIISLGFFRLRVLSSIKFLFTHGDLFKIRKDYAKNPRGMSSYYDLVDWIGGYPFEVAKPEEVFSFFKSRGFNLIKMKTCAGGLGCNEFVFVKE